jgi:tRNA A-37 threonylcarbamoyl transferase component Bud32
VIELDSAVPFAGRYRVVRRIAAGGMGAVFEVVHVETQRRRALKVMLPELVSNQELRDRFQMEARVTAHVDSEYIVDVFDAGIDTTTGMPFLVMELLRGEELGDVLRRAGALTPQDTVTYLRQVASALDKTHSAGIVHRDLKPENLFLTHREDGAPRIKILDFGISKVVNDATSGAKATRSLGTPLYMAPEQVLGLPVGPATDLYSLGMMTYTLLVGVCYWQTDAQLFENAIAFALHTTKGATESPVAKAARLGRWLPPAFDAWFARATHLDAGSRFQRASELVNSLADLLGEAGAGRALTPLSALTPLGSATVVPALSAQMGFGTAPGTGFDRQGTIPEAPRGSGRGRWLIAAGVLGVSGLGLAGAIAYRSSSRTSSAGSSVPTSAPSVALAARPEPAPLAVVPLAENSAVAVVSTAAPSASTAAASPSVSASAGSLAPRAPVPRRAPLNAAHGRAGKEQPAAPVAVPYTRD